jgi:hypothetical protein
MRFGFCHDSRLAVQTFNMHPAFRGTGGRVIAVAKDLRHIRVRLPLNWRTRNLVGSLYGGSLFAITDGPHPMMLMVALGGGYIVWDKAASIRFRKPGFSTLYADFVLSNEEMTDILAALRDVPELERTYLVELKDVHGAVHAVVERTVYIADKTYYRQKLGAGG